MKESIIILLLSLALFSNAQDKEINNPIDNFEKLWLEFDTRYANFELKNINWDEIYKKYRPRVNDKTTNEELFVICCSMVQELNDGHVTIVPDFENNNTKCGPPYKFHFQEEFETKEKLEQFFQVINSTLTSYGFSSVTKCKVTEETNFQYRISPSYGYLRLDEMTEENTFGKFRKALNKVMREFQDKKGIIIDLRFNGGGDDKISYKLANRLIPDGKTVGHYKRDRIKGENKFEDMEFKELKPKGKHRYNNSIVILTSDFTASASEVFILLLKDLENVTLIGDVTEGIFSEMLEFQLPNEWEVSLSHQQFFDQNKINYEGIGIKPYIHVLNTRIDIEEQRDKVIETALQFLKETQ